MPILLKTFFFDCALSTLVLLVLSTSSEYIKFGISCALGFRPSEATEPLRRMQKIKLLFVILISLTIAIGYYIHQQSTLTG